MAKAECRSITRRHVVAACAAVPLSAAFPVLALEGSDPIFAAIAEHRCAYADILALLDQQAAGDRALQAADVAARPALAARLNALYAAEGPLGRVEMRASERLAATVPQTLAGAGAVLRYVRELLEHDDYPLYEEDGYRALLFSTECAIERAIGSAPSSRRSK